MLEACRGSSRGRKGVDHFRFFLLFFCYLFHKWGVMIPTIVSSAFLVRPFAFSFVSVLSVVVRFNVLSIERVFLLVSRSQLK